MTGAGHGARVQRDAMEAETAHAALLRSLAIHGAIARALGDGLPSSADETAPGRAACKGAVDDEAVAPSVAALGGVLAVLIPRDASTPWWTFTVAQLRSTVARRLDGVAELALSMGGVGPALRQVGVRPADQEQARVASAVMPR